MQEHIDKTQIEKAGVNAVIKYFNYSKTILPIIPTEDKIPVWDGYLLLYKNDKTKNENLIGPIPVQVKSHASSDLTKKEISFSLNVKDLNIYKLNKGVAFFVVYIDLESEIEKIYYRLLAPIELRQLVFDARNNKKISLTFKELPKPSQKAKVETLFREFFYHCLKQQSFSNQKPIQFNDIKDEIKSIDIFYTAPSGSEYETLKHLSKTPQFCYVTLKNDPTSTLHPVGEGRQPVKAGIIYDIPVRIGDKVYYDEVICEFKNGESYWVIDNCLRVPFTNSPLEVNKKVQTQIQLNFKTLSQRIKYFTFLKAVEEAGYFCIGDDTFVIDRKTSPKDDFLEPMLKTDMEIQSIFDKLHVNEDLLLTNISKQDIHNLSILMSHFVQDKPVRPSKSYNNKFELVRLDVNNIKLLFIPSRIGETNDYRLISVHNLTNIFKVEPVSNNKFVILPGFCFFDSKSYKDVCNITYENFLNECNTLKSDDRNYYEAINHSIFQMIQAYDQQENKKQVLIETALSLNQWLIENDSDDDMSLIHELNKLQILKRMQGLSEKEKDFLYDTIDANNSNEEVKFVCYTLLENKEAATRCFRKLPLEVQRFNETLPIFNLFNSLNH